MVGEETEVSDPEGKRFKMPLGDRSGPDGRGPRGGVCVGAGLSRFFGFGRGQGLGRGYAGVYPVNQVSSREALENRTLELERELAILKGRLESSSEKSES